jgi:hypothetical protein
MNPAKVFLIQFSCLIIGLSLNLMNYLYHWDVIPIALLFFGVGIGIYIGTWIDKEAS